MTRCRRHTGCEGAEMSFPAPPPGVFRQRKRSWRRLCLVSRATTLVCWLAPPCGYIVVKFVTLCVGCCFTFYIQSKRNGQNIVQWSARWKWALSAANRVFKIIPRCWAALSSSSYKSPDYFYEVCYLEKFGQSLSGFCHFNKISCCVSPVSGSTEANEIRRRRRLVAETKQLQTATPTAIHHQHWHLIAGMLSFKSNHSEGLCYFL